MSAEAAPDSRLSGVTFAKQYPNASEPFRGAFVAEQVAATRSSVDWAVVVPVPWVPRALAGVMRRAHISGTSDSGGVPIEYAPYPVLPRRMLYSAVAPTIVRTARGAFDRAADAVGAHFVHAHDLYPSGAAARRLAARRGLPLVVSVHGSDLYTNLDVPAWRAEIEATASAASAIICVGSRLARDAVELIGAEPSRTLVIPDTYDAVRFRHVERSAHDGSVRLLSVGRLSAEKGHDVLLRAFAALRAGGLDVTLTLVGDGRERSRLTELAVALHVAEHVRFTGALSAAPLADELAAADLFVLPSRREGFGVALVEALATGLPAVATDSGGPADIITPENGELCPPDDAEALRTSLGRAIDRLGTFDSVAIASDVARRFSPESVAVRMVAVYRQVVSGQPLTGTLAEEAVR